MLLPITREHDVNSLLCSGANAAVRVNADRGHRLEFVAAGSIHRLTDNLSHAYDVRDYGAVGDGVTDDTAAIQAAITAAAAGPTRQVYLPAAAVSYRVSSAISVPNFVHLVGDGIGSLLEATGNHFILDLNPANSVHIRHLAFQAANAQTGGGAIDFTNAAHNITITDCTFINNLYCSLQVTPALVGAGLYHFARLRWNGVANHTFPIYLGDGTHLLCEVHFVDISGTAVTAADVATAWCYINANVDTVYFTDTTFYRGTDGFRFSGDASITAVHLNKCVLDSQTNYGANILGGRNIDLSACDIQTNGVGVNVGALCTGVRIRGCAIQGNQGDGIKLNTGARATLVAHNIVSDNNTNDGVFGVGISAYADADDFTIAGNWIGNGLLLATGHQKFGIEVAVGSSTGYLVQGNQYRSNESGDGLYDKGSLRDPSLG